MNQTEQRPYERCEAQGPGALSDAELLAVILQTGGPGMSATDLAEQVLALSGTDPGILGLLHLSMAELRSICGIGRVKAIKLSCIGELSRRIYKAKVQRGPTFGSPQEIAEYYMEDMRHLTQEHLLLVLLNNKNQRIREVVISKGTVNASLASPREIYIEALRNQAVRIVLLHNHPSGDVSPSQIDMNAMERIKSVGELLSLPLMDFIICGDISYFSAKKQSLI